MISARWLRRAGGERVFPEFAVDVVDDAGSVVARVRKTLYVRLKKPAVTDAGGVPSAE